MARDLRDFYIKYLEHPRFSINKLIEEEAVEIIVNKIEMVLFTNKGEVYGDQNFGADLYYYLHQTKVSKDTVEEVIREQFRRYIPELASTSYTLTVSILPGNFQDILLVDIQIEDVVINAIFN